jgi:predicted cobalt transporter CbtA
VAAPLSFGCILRRSILTGMGAGAAAGLVSLIVVEPVIRAALAVEAARASAADVHEELFSRPVQVAGGLLTAVVVGIVLGVVFAVVWARTRHWLPAVTDFGRCLVLAAAGFGVLALLPWVKYPANPPAVGDPATVGERTWLYVSLLAGGVLVLLGLAALATALRRRGWASPMRVTAVTAAGVVGFVALLMLWPASPDSVPADVPAELLWRFRLASLAQLAALWAVLGFGTGLLLAAPWRDRVAESAAGAVPAAP